ncbi:MAG: hypothetical protein IJV51_06620 [Oscillospiraceae bacterium]|nr:hypothetical protein [Oscillospiraceae bacterium]
MKTVIKIARWFLCGLLIMFTAAFAPSAASLLFLLAAVIACPLSFVKDFLSRLRLSGIKAAILALVFLVGGFVTAPVDRARPEADSAVVIETLAPVETSPETVSRSLETPTPTPSPAPTPTPTATPRPSPTPAPEKTYILNTNSGKFHKPYCSSVSDIAPGNMQEYTGSRDELIANGYTPCKRCNP